MKEIKMTPVVSSQIKSAGYDNEEQNLYVEFKNEKIYQYSDVPEYIYDNLIKDPSPGAYFNAAIRGVYDYLFLNVFVSDNAFEIE